MRIGLNLLHALREIGGGWNYIENLLKAVAKHDRSNSYVAFTNTESIALVPDDYRWEIVRCVWNARRRPIRILCENTWLQAAAVRYRVDCMHWFGNVHGIINVVPSLTSIYDLQPFTCFNSFSPLRRAYLRLMLRKTCSREGLILPMSEATRDDLATKLGVADERMFVLPAVIESDFSPQEGSALQSFVREHKLPSSYWLYVAHLYPNKNHARLFQAAGRLKKAGLLAWPIVLRGDYLQESAFIKAEVQREGIGEEVIFVPRLERSQLPLLYGAASGLVFPSLYEGCGIPVREAMACGCPVVAADIAAVRESAGGAAVYFDPMNVESIADAMSKFYADAELRERCRAAGFARSRLLGGEMVAARLVEAYRIAAGRRSETRRQAHGVPPVRDGHPASNRPGVKVTHL